MKRQNYILMILVATTALLTGCNKEDKDDNNDYYNDKTSEFDPDFAKVLQEKGYISDATHITLADVKDIERLDVGGTYEDYEAGKGLTSLKGIEYFESLVELNCANNQLTSLDFSKNTELVWLWCYENQLTTLDISKNTELAMLECNCNQLTSLDVSKNTKLARLYCHLNQLTSLDFSKNTKLTYLHCNWNQLTTLDFNKNTELTELNCNSNNLTNLDVSKNTELTYLSCNHNQLTNLDVSQNTKLTELDCNSNNLTDLDISKNTKLTKLIYYHNPGNGKTFPITIWKGYENTLDIKNTDPWGENGQTITIDIQVVE